MPEIQNQFQLEIHISQMIPIFIENLGSPKAVVRKSSHKCIGTYVKLTKKLEYVIRQIIKIGLENHNSRTRQHSMLVIPALISLKSQIMDNQTEEMKELILAVIRRIQIDSSEIVAKTGKKLVLELQKCYPQSFKANYIDCLRDQKTQKICEAIILNDENGLKEVLNNYENNKQINSAQKQEQIPFQQNLVQLQKSDNKQSIHKKMELSNIGREVISPAPVLDYLKDNLQKMTEIKVQDENKSSKLEGKNFQNLHFGFIPDKIISSANEQKDIQERTEALQAIENLLNDQLQTVERKEQFIIYQNQFVEFLIPLIKDQTLKISLTAINMMNKLLVLDLLQKNIHFNQIVITLIEKFSDIKIIIRQAILKCCGLLIKRNNPCKFAEIAINYIKHTNWHVREGILHLIANCLIIQEQNNELMGKKTIKPHKDEHDQNIKDQDLSLNPHLIEQLCQLLKNEGKEKIQQMAIDNLSLCLEVSTQNQKTEQLISRQLQEDTQIDGQYMKKIKERQNNECLPSMQIDGSIEFKPLDVQQMLQTAQMNKNNDIFLHRNRQNVEIKSKDSIIISLPTNLIQDEIDLNSSKLNDQSFKIESSLRNDKQYVQSKLISPKKDFQILAQNESTFQNAFNFQEEKSQIINNRNPSIIKTQIDDPSPIKQDLKNNQMFQNQNDGDKKIISISKINYQEQSAFIKNERSFEKPKVQSIQTKDISNQDNENRFEKLMSGYTPIQHSMKPRIIQSNENRQRTIENNIEKKNGESPSIFQKTASNQIKNTDFISLQNQSPIIISNQIDSRSQQINYQGKIIDHQNSYINGGSSVESQNQTGGMQSDFQSSQIRNMSQSSGAPGGFKVNKALINERLQLLKSTFKYKNQSENETRSYIGETAEGVGRSNFESAERRLQFEEFIVGTIKQKAVSEYNPREDIKLPAVHQNNNNFMMQQTNGSGIMSKLGESGNQKEKNAQSTHNSFGLSNVSTNLNHNHLIVKNNNFKSFSANKQLQSTNNTSGSNNFSNNSQNFIGKDQKYIPQRNENYSKNIYLNDQNNQSALNKSNFQENEHIETYGGLRNSKNKFPQTQFNGKGPVKAVSLVQSHQEYLNTIQQEKQKLQPSKINSKYQQLEDNISFNQSNSSKISEQKKQSDLQMNSLQNKSQSTTKKPPINTFKQQQPLISQAKHNIIIQNENKNETKHNYITPTKNWIFNSNESQISNNLVAQNSNQTAIQFSNAFDNTPQGESQHQTSTHYNSPEEPLINPDSQFKQSVSNLNSQDWQKVFESLNIIKRVAQFHKELFSMTDGNFLPKECIKNVVKQTENLRSQVAKNACMTLQVIYTELPTKDLDCNIDIVTASLLKKSTDTNHFVSEQAEKALKMVCHACTETKVLNSLINYESKSNLMKQKITLCYCFLIEKLGFKIKDFKENGKLVKCISNMLNEGALEVRNQGKSAIIQIKNNFQNGREFDILLMKSGLTDKQIEQIRKVVDQSEQASVANTTHYTRYGGSIRGSSLDSRVNPASQHQSEYKQDVASNYNLQIQKSAQSKGPFKNVYENQSNQK